MDQRKLIRWYLLAWLLYLIYVCIDNLIDKQQTPLSLLPHFIGAFFEFSFCFFFVFPVWLKKNRLPLFVLGLALSAGLFVLLDYLIAGKLLPLLINHQASDTLMNFVKHDWWPALQIILLSLIVWNAVAVYSREREKAQLKSKHQEAELAFYRFSANNAFLNDTLTYTSSAVYLLSDVLGEVLAKVGSLAHYLQQQSIDSVISLRQEIDYLNTYLEVYKFRFGENFFTKFAIDGDVQERRIAALLLISITEDALNHSVYNDPQWPVRIQLKLIGNRLIFTLSHRIKSGYNVDASESGLSAIKKRLEIVYPNRHELLIADNGRTHKLTLNIDLHE